MNDECEMKVAGQYPHSAINEALVAQHHRLLEELRSLRHQIAGTGEQVGVSGQTEPAQAPSLREVLESAPGQIDATSELVLKEIAEIRNLLFS